MKNANLISRLSKQIDSKNEEAHNLKKGIMKALLDKYKPSIGYKIETLNEKKIQSRIA